MYDRHDRPDHSPLRLLPEALHVARAVTGSALLEAAIATDRLSEVLTRAGIWTLGVQQAVRPTFVSDREASMARHPAGKARTA